MKTKLAIMRSTLGALGDLFSAATLLKRSGHTQEAKIVSLVSSLVIDEIDLKLAEQVSLSVLQERLGVTPMTQTEKRQMRQQMKRHRPRAKKWLCCTRPKKQVTHGKTHKPMWISTCQYQLLAGKERGQTMSMTLVVGRDLRHTPKQVTRKGKKLRWCL